MRSLSKRLSSLTAQDAERRHHRRESDPWLRVETEGFAYLARDWSAGGVSIPRFHDAGPVGTLLSGEAGWTCADTLAPFMATIVRRDPDGTVALRWLDAERDFLTELDVSARRR